MSEYSRAYGVWKVTTEGDCEGKSITNLGIHEGFLDEIAFSLGKRVGYSLRFVKVEPIVKQKYAPRCESVNVSLGIDSGTWNMSPKSRIEYFNDLLEGRHGFTIKDGSYHASVKLSRKKTLTKAQKMVKRLEDAGFDPTEVINTFKQR